MSDPLLAPFPYFGGKRSVTADVWARFGSPKQLRFSPSLRRAAADALHVRSVKFVLTIRVSGCDGLKAVARFALSLQAVDIAPVCIELAPRLRFAALGATLLSSPPRMAILVFRVLGRRIPSQILKIVVRWVCVWEVACVVPRRWGLANECQEHKAMNLRGNNSAVQVKCEGAISVVSRVMLKATRWAKASGSTIISPLALECPNRAIRTSEIVRESWDWSEFCFHSFLIPKPTLFVNRGRC